MILPQLGAGQRYDQLCRSGGGVSDDGKYPDGPIEEVARDRDILRAALAILDGCYEVHAGVKRWIDEAA